MAIDTETKRRSVLGMTIIPLLVAPVPDGTVANVDREHVVGIYAGIAPASGGVAYTSCGVPFLYTAANWLGAAFYHEAYMKATSGTVYARIYDVTAAAEVASSEISTAETSSTRLRSLAITLTDTHVYMLQTGTTGAGEIKGGQLIAI